jgi:carbonic anhydrase
MLSYSAAALLAVNVFASGGASYVDTTTWSEDAPTCGSGMAQSPIDLSTNSEKNDELAVEDVGFYDFPVNEEYSSTDDAKKVSFDATLRTGATLELTFADSTTAMYNPLQFHFHSPSEHTIDGANMDVEVHFVHTLVDDPSTYAVVAVLFDRVVGGADKNPFIASVEAAINSREQEDPENRSDALVKNFLEEADVGDEFWSYDGSFTTPPCTEGLKWTVYKDV